MLRRRLEEGTIAVPEDMKLWDELVTIRWSVNSTGKIQLEAKDELRERRGGPRIARTRWRWPWRP